MLTNNVILNKKKCVITAAIVVFHSEKTYIMCYITGYISKYKQRWKWKYLALVLF